jgi:hypothetical protein
MPLTPIEGGRCSPARLPSRKQSPPRRCRTGGGGRSEASKDTYKADLCLTRCGHPRAKSRKYEEQEIFGGLEQFPVPAALARWWHSVTRVDGLRLGFRLTAGTGTGPASRFQPGREVPDDHCRPIHRTRHDPARLHRRRTARPCRFLAGYRGLTREAFSLDLRQFTTWCRARSLALFAARRADQPAAVAHRAGLRVAARPAERCSIGSGSPPPAGHTGVRE